MAEASTTVDTQPLQFLHRRILNSIEQLGGAMDAATERPAQLLRDMEAQQQDREREREEWEREREDSAKAGMTVEERVRTQAVEIEDLKRELRVSNMARDAARRELEQSQQKQRSLQLDLNSAQQELQMMRLELNLLRPYEVAPLPSAALQPDHPELRPPPSPRGPPLVRGDASGAAADASGAGSGLSNTRQPSARPTTAAGRQPVRPSTAKAQRPMTAPDAAAALSPRGEQTPYWEQQARQLAKANQRLESVLAATAFQPYNVPGVSAPMPGRPTSARPTSARGAGAKPPGSASPRSPRTPRLTASHEAGGTGLGSPGGLRLGLGDPLVMLPSMR